MKEQHVCYKKLKIILLADHDAALISLKMIIWWVGWGYVKKEKQIQQILYIGGSHPPVPPAWGQLVSYREDILRLFFWVFSG